MRYHELITESKLHGLTVMSLDQFVKQQSGQQEVDEAEFGLGAKSRPLAGQELQDYLGRMKTKEKTKRDRFDFPYTHPSNIEVTNDQGQPYDQEGLKKSIMQRPSSLLTQNQKMQHSDGSKEVYYNIGLPALKGLAVNEQTGEFVVVDTCPGAGACKTFCYAFQGSYVMFKAVNMKQTRTLNFLLNDPEGFVRYMNAEIMMAVAKNHGSKIVVRWHDAGDFFSPEYMAVAISIAQSNPNVTFYAYTKIASVAQGQLPPNFKMNFSQGAHASQERKIDFVKTKHSRVVPAAMFWDLIARDKNKLHKDAQGRMQFKDQASLNQFKQDLATKYKLDPKTILTHDEMDQTPVGNTPQWNVIVMPGDGDDAATRPDVLGSYLLFH